MLNIAVVEDDKEQAEKLEEMLKRYSREYDTPVQISTFYNAVIFLEKYAAQWDIIFMDIMIPMMDGMTASHILREKDSQVMLIFVTSMQQYAVQGYEVGAADFIVKPLSYPEFKLKLKRAVQRLSLSRGKTGGEVLIKTDSGYVKLTPEQIAYVEVQGHHCIFHTRTGQFRQYQTIKSVSAQLEKHGFVRCNNFLLVNLAFVTKIEGMDVFVGDEVLQMSHPRKKEFSQRFAEYSEGQKYD